MPAARNHSGNHVLRGIQQHQLTSVRELTPAEQEQLRALGEAMAQQALGPDWKKAVVEKQIMATASP